MSSEAESLSVSMEKEGWSSGRAERDPGSYPSSLSQNFSVTLGTSTDGIQEPRQSLTLADLRELKRCRGGSLWRGFLLPLLALRSGCHLPGWFGICLLTLQRKRVLRG